MLKAAIAGLFIIGLIVLSSVAVPLVVATYNRMDDHASSYLIHGNLLSAHPVATGRFLLYILLWGLICGAIFIILNNISKKK